MINAALLEGLRPSTRFFFTPISSTPTPAYPVIPCLPPLRARAARLRLQLSL